MSDWSLLEDELSRWRESGRAVELWWRDDDAEDVTAQLERLLEVQHRTGMPLSLAIVPARATASLAERLADEPHVDLLQHGYAHVNHAPAPDKKSELGHHRPFALALGDLGTGWLAMERLFGSEHCRARLLNVLVPPWNRIAPGLMPALPEIGFAGLSTYGARPRSRPVPGLLQINTHLDLIDWHSRVFIGTGAALERLAAALAAARSAPKGPSPEPIGILTHHLAMDEAAWDFLLSLLEKTTNKVGVKWLGAREMFASGEARA